MTATAYQLALAGMDLSAANHAEQFARCVAIARDLARHGPITIDEVRIVAGLYEGKGRELSFLGGVMRKAGLVPTGQRVRSDLAVTHGNLRMQWRLP
jgi:hypothetical protein